MPLTTTGIWTINFPNTPLINDSGANAIIVVNIVAIKGPRTSFVQLTARRNAKILHLSGLAAFFRNMVMGYAGNKIFNKLYSYDALSAVNSKEI